MITKRDARNIFRVILMKFIKTVGGHVGQIIWALLKDGSVMPKAITGWIYLIMNELTGMFYAVKLKEMLPILIKVN